MTQEVEPYREAELPTAVDAFSSELSDYLAYLGLPREAVLVPVGERRDVINNMPTVVRDLSDAQRERAQYISKFVAACAVGLFDAALNFLWNETIRNLRDKVARFDLEYFYDSVITDPDRRSKFKDAADLDNLDDWVLIRGCLTTGIITDIGYKHLDYIRDMRNYASAAHPNQNQLTGLQVVTWLQTCIREVLAKEPEGPVIEVRRLLRSLRQETLSEDSVGPIASAVELLPDDLSRSLLRVIFGMYTDSNLGADIRNNIRLIAEVVWGACSEEARFEAGLKFASLTANAEVTRAGLAREFLQRVDGLSYLPPDALGLEMTTALDALLTAHNGWDNFYNEPPHARMVQSVVPASGDVPNSVVRKYIKVLTMCRIGNGHGVSWAAEPIYNNLISRWRDTEIVIFVNLTRDAEVASRLQFTSCAQKFQALANRLQDQATSPRLKRALEFLAKFPTNALGNIRRDSRFQGILNTLGGTA
jgi:hypothetical protein